MLLKDISYLELWQPYYSAKQNHLFNFSRGHNEEQFCEFISNLGQLFRRCRLKNFLSGVLVAPCSMEQNLKCKLERGHNEHSCADISNLDQLFRRRCCLKIFLICSTGAPFVHLCHFGRGLQEEQFCEIILNLNHWFKKRFMQF